MHDRKRFTKRPVYLNPKDVPPSFACDPIIVRGHLVPNAVELRIEIYDESGWEYYLMRKKKLVLYYLENMNIKNSEYLNNELDLIFFLILKMFFLKVFKFQNIMIY